MDKEEEDVEAGINRLGHHPQKRVGVPSGSYTNAVKAGFLLNSENTHVFVYTYVLPERCAFVSRDCITATSLSNFTQT